MMCKCELAAAAGASATGLSERYRDETEVCNGGRACAAPALRTQGIKNTLTALSVFAWPISQFQHSLASLQLALQKAYLNPFCQISIYDEMS